MMQMFFSKPDESAGTKHRKVSLRPITGVVNGTRPAIRLERVCRSTLKAKTDQAGEVVGYEAPDKHSECFTFDILQIEAFYQAAKKDVLIELEDEARQLLHDIIE